MALSLGGHLDLLSTTGNALGSTMALGTSSAPPQLGRVPQLGSVVTSTPASVPTTTSPPGLIFDMSRVPSAVNLAFGSSLVSTDLIFDSARPPTVSSFVAVFDSAGTMTPMAYSTTGTCNDICFAYMAYDSSLMPHPDDPTRTSWQFNINSYQTWTMTSAFFSGGSTLACLPIVATQAFLKTRDGYSVTDLAGVSTLRVISSMMSGLATDQGLHSCGSMPGFVALRRALLGVQVSSLFNYRGPALSPATASASGATTLSQSYVTATSTATAVGTSLITNASGPSADQAPADGLSTGAKVGIGVGISAVFLLMLGIFVLLALGRRRKQLAARKADAMESVDREHGSTTSLWDKAELQGNARSELHGSSNIRELSGNEKYELDATERAGRLDGRCVPGELPVEERAVEIG